MWVRVRGCRSQRVLAPRSPGRQAPPFQPARQHFLSLAPGLRGGPAVASPSSEATVLSAGGSVPHRRVPPGQLGSQTRVWKVSPPSTEGKFQRPPLRTSHHTSPPLVARQATVGPSWTGLFQRDFEHLGKRRGVGAWAHWDSDLRWGSVSHLCTPASWDPLSGGALCGQAWPENQSHRRGAWGRQSSVPLWASDAPSEGGPSGPP